MKMIKVLLELDRFQITSKKIKILFSFFLITLIGFQIEAQKLHPYTCIVDHVDQGRWMKDYNRKFDSIGIVTQKNEYHALSIAMFGIMNYENYLSTGDTSYLNNVKNQYKYFADDSRVDYIDEGKGLGLPYHFKFKDLQPKWYSGMTQGYAISFLLRYYELTKDKEALKKVQQMAYFMLRPVSEGGAIGKTEEGYTFIEEYPGSKNAPQVLNGFINGLIGLKEYLTYFPKDTLAQRIHNESYESMIKTFEMYDTHNWTNYARKGGGVTNHYMRYQLSELEHLNYLYNDSNLVRQKMIWSYFATAKNDTKFQSHKNSKYKYAERIPFVDSIYQINRDETLKRLGRSDAYNLQQNRKDFKKDKYLKAKKTIEIKFEKPVYFGSVEFDAPLKNIKIKSNDVKFDFNDDSLFFESEKPLNSLAFNAHPKKGQKIKIEAVNILDTRKFPTNEFAFLLVDSVYNLNQMLTYELEVMGSNNPGTIVFYRFNHATKNMNNIKWKQYNCFNRKDSFMPEESGFYQFLIVAPNDKLGTKFDSFFLKEI